MANRRRSRWTRQRRSELSLTQMEEEPPRRLKRPALRDLRANSSTIGSSSTRRERSASGPLGALASLKFDYRRRRGVPHERWLDHASGGGGNRTRVGVRSRATPAHCQTACQSISGSKTSMAFSSRAGRDPWVARLWRGFLRAPKVAFRFSENRRASPTGGSARFRSHCSVALPKTTRSLRLAPFVHELFLDCRRQAARHPEVEPAVAGGRPLRSRTDSGSTERALLAWLGRCGP